MVNKRDKERSKNFPENFYIYDVNKRLILNKNLYLPIKQERKDGRTPSVYSKIYNGIGEDN